MRCKKIIMAFVVLFLCLVTGNVANAATVKLDETNFPDQALRKALERYVDSDGNIETDKIKYFFVSSDMGAVKDLKGMELLTEMTGCSLFLYEGTSVTLANPKLQEFSIYDTTQETMDIQLSTAKKLNFCSSDTKTLSITGPELTEVSLNGGAITTINGLNQLSKMTTFGLIESNLTSFDVGVMPQVEKLTISSSKVQTLKNLDQLKNLKELTVAYNKLKKLDLTANTKLTSVNCNDNQLTSLKLPKSIKKVYAAENKLTSLDLKKCPNLQYLHIYDNKLKKIDLKKCTKLSVVELNGNKNLSSVNVTKNKKLASLNVGCTSIKSLNVNKNTKLTALQCYKTKISSLNIKKNKKLSYISFYGSKIKKLDLSGYKTMTIDYELKRGKSINLKNYLGTGYTLDYVSEELSYNKSSNTIKLSTKAKKNYMYYATLTKNSKTYYITIIAQ